MLDDRFSTPNTPVTPGCHKGAYVLVFKLKYTGLLVTSDGISISKMYLGKPIASLASSDVTYKLTLRPSRNVHTRV